MAYIPRPAGGGASISNGGGTVSIDAVGEVSITAANGKPVNMAGGSVKFETDVEDPDTAIATAVLGHAFYVGDAEDPPFQIVPEGVLINGEPLNGAPAAGANGTNGADGVGVPIGGTTGQILAKVDATNFNTGWIDAPSGGGDMLASVYDSAGAGYISGAPSTGGVLGGVLIMDAQPGHYGGGVQTQAGAGGSGGGIATAGGASIGANGGAITTYGATLPGGSIETYDGGGSISTRGTGLLELGATGTRTTLTGTATADRAQSLPDKDGTVAMLSDRAVVAVKSVTMTGTQTTTSTSWVDVTDGTDPLTITYTPTSASNLILVRAIVAGSGGTSPACGASFRLVRDSTPIGVGASASPRELVGASMPVPGNADTLYSAAMEVMDAPATVSPVTYKVQYIVITGGGGTGYVNRGVNDSTVIYDVRAASTLTIMEVTPQ